MEALYPPQDFPEGHGVAADARRINQSSGGHSYGDYKFHGYGTWLVHDTSHLGTLPK